MARDMEKEINELKKQNSYLLDRLEKSYNDKMILRQESMKSQTTVETVKEAVKEIDNASI
jgi:hypothetical protein|tara:strand:- start:381 stop:560 length:180 start_codon:yes stop_codon:yes gene_type:complete